MSGEVDVFKAEETGDMLDMFLDVTSKACAQGSSGQRRVNRSRSPWAWSHIKEFGLCPEAGVQKLKERKQRWQDCLGCSLEHRSEGLTWKPAMVQVRDEKGLH